MKRSPLASFVLLGMPAPKGNSRQVWRIRGRRTVVMAPSKAFLAWQQVARLQLAHQWRRPSIMVPVQVTAVFYRDARADVDNCVKGLGDLLQHAGVLKNDRLIKKWEASLVRTPKTGQRRVEITIAEAP